jgi:Ca2+-binding EF-hand superfamily protein
MGNKGTKKSRSNELNPKEIIMLKSNTQYSESEIREWHANFLRDCPNGKLNKKQFIDMYKKFLKHDTADAFCKLAFSAFDTNHDGSIDFDEFLLCIAATSQGDLDHRLEVVFDICDSSDDGQIDRKELANMISVMYDLFGETNRHGDHDPKKRAAEIIAGLDVNNDKKLNKYEFIAGCKNDPTIRRLLVPYN